MTAFNDVALNFSNIILSFPKFDRGPFITVDMFNKVNVSVKLEW